MKGLSLSFYFSLRILFGSLILLVSLSGSSQSIQFDLPDQICLEEKIDTQQSSTGINQYIWDFCFNDLQNITTVEDVLTITDTNSPESIKIVYDSGAWYGFVGSRLSDQLFRLDFGSSLNNVPSITNLGNLGEASLRPNAIEFIKENQTWYGLIVSQTGNFYRLTFADHLSGNFTVENLGDLSSWLYVWDLDIEYDDSNTRWIAAIADGTGSKITMIDFGNSISNSPVTILDIGLSEPDISNPRGLDIIQTASGWYGLVADIGSDQIILASFGSDPMTEPMFTSLYSPPNPVKVELMQEGLNYTAHVLTLSSGLYRLNFGNDLTDDLGFESLGTFGVLTVNNSFDIIRDSPVWKGFVMDHVNKELSRISFSGDCISSINMNSSTEASPENLEYITTDEYLIELTGLDQYGNEFVAQDTISVLNQTAPLISFTSINECFTAQIAFTPTPGLTTYSWDFNEDGIEDSNLENPSYQFPASGTYTVRLDVDDGTCGNFTEQEITIYEEPPIPDFVITGNLCANGEITFTNTTLDDSYLGPLSYEWDFDGQGTVSTRDATFTFESAGMKTVTLTSSIPGCENVFQQVINLANGPTSLLLSQHLFFSANSVCEGNLTTFDNQSLEATSYLWDFGDGTTSTAEDPTHLYAGGGNYMVQLAATDLLGCTALLDQEVVVSFIPTADFDFDVPCSGEAGVTFFDQSNGNGSDILSWEWTIDGEVSSNEQNPLISFDEAGTRLIGLEVLSSNGCTSQYQESIDFLASPQPTFSIDLACQNLATSFLDTTPEETVVNRLWEIDGQNYTTQEVDHIFTQAGSFDVSLTVTSSDFCSSTISSTIEIPAEPSLDFELSSTCVGELIVLSDVSTSGANPVVSRTWSLDGESFFNGPQAQLPQEISVGSHEISLESTTDIGCVFSSTRTIEILPSPIAAFEASGDYGVPPFTISFENNSVDANSYSWLVDEVEVSTSSELTHLFTSEGSHAVKLIATSANGCEDEVELEILSALPAIDLQIDQLTLTPNGSTQTISLMVANNGNLPVEIFDVIISTGNDFSISERINEFLDIGEQTQVQLSSAIQSINASKVCVSIVSAYEDVTPDDNEQCVSFIPNIIVENPYPNPVIDEAVIKVILPKSADVQLILTSTTGHSLISESHEELASGLNILRIDTSQLEKGIYFVSLKYQDKVVTKRIFKN